MSQFTASNDEDHGASATAHTAAHEASEVAETAGEAARGVVETGAHEASAVASEASARFGELVSQTGRELSDQAAGQQQRLATGLGTVGDDLSRMADADDGGGFAGELVRRAAGHVSTVGSWLGERDPQQVLQDVSAFARRRPATFIAAAAIAGVVVGRLSRALAAGANTDSPAASPSTDGPRFAEADTRARADERGTASTDAVGSSAGAVATVDTANTASSTGPDGTGPDGSRLGDAGTDDTGLDGTGLDDTGLVAGVDGGDPPLYTESAERLASPGEGTGAEGVSDDRPDTV